MCTNNIEIKYWRNVIFGLHIDNFNHAKAVACEYISFLILYDPLRAKFEDNGFYNSRLMIKKIIPLILISYSN